MLEIPKGTRVGIKNTDRGVKNGIQADNHFFQLENDLKIKDENILLKDVVVENLKNDKLRALGIRCFSNKHVVHVVMAGDLILLVPVRSLQGLPLYEDDLDFSGLLDVNMSSVELVEE